MYFHFLQLKLNLILLHTLNNFWIFYFYFIYLLIYLFFYFQFPHHRAENFGNRGNFRFQFLTDLHVLGYEKYENQKIEVETICGFVCLSILES